MVNTGIDITSIGTWGYFDDIIGNNTLVSIGTWGYIFEEGQPVEVLKFTSTIKLSETYSSDIQLSETYSSDIQLSETHLSSVVF